MYGISALVVGFALLLVGLKVFNPFLSPQDKPKGKELQKKFNWLYITSGVIIFSFGLIKLFA